MTSHLFQTHGEFCTSHPWEVIVATLTLTACMLSVEQQNPIPSSKPTIMSCLGCIHEAEYNAVDLIAMTIVRSLAVLYYYYQFRRIHNLGSKFILGIAGLFTVFSSFVFTTTIINILRIKIGDLKDALFFFLLLSDLSKVAKLAQYALNAEGKNNIAKGLAALGPTITLDTIVETLVIGVGTLSGVQRLEIISWFACLSVLVNYLIFMTFYPACLSLVKELSNSKTKDSWTIFCFEEDQKSNPALQRVKLIMSVGLMLVHVHSRWPFKEREVYTIEPLDPSAIHGFFIRWLTLSADRIVILILVSSLLIKLIFFENKESYAEVKQQQWKATYEDKEIQTLVPCTLGDDIPNLTRSLNNCLKIYNNIDLGAKALSDDEIIMLVNNKHIAAYQIEKAIDDLERGVRIRRKILENNLLDTTVLDKLPYKNYDYSFVMGACCENVIGYMPIPVGYAGPLLLDGKELYVPMATTEGCLVASTNRGCRALKDTQGITSTLIADGMTRGPVVRFPSIVRASEAMQWMQQNFEMIKQKFDSTSRFARLQQIFIKIAGRFLFIRFVATTGDAMGMNMLSKGTEISLKYVQTIFDDMEILSLSGNFCTDKKPAAINWIEGRGKTVVCEAIVPSEVVQNILKTNVHALIDVNISKNMVGSAVAGSIGGFNAQAANIVTAIFLATGQDPAQNVSSSNCMTLMEPWGPDGKDLYISCTMPSIEIGTIGGGTILPAQGACLELLGVKGSNAVEPGANACQLAKIICATVLAGELSLMSALTAGHLVKSHLKHNRSTTLLPEAFLPPCKDSGIS